MLRVGLIGCGGIGKVHAAVWSEMTDKASLVAIAELDREKWATAICSSETKFYADAIEMMQKENLDVVDICTPSASHAKLITIAADYVKNIIVEKPICLYEKDADELIKLAKEKDVTIHVGQVDRFLPQNKYLKELVDNGKYGKLLSGYFFHLSPDPTWVVDRNNPTKTGGMALDLHVHDVDLIRHVMGGDPDDVSSVVHKRTDGTVDHIWSSYRYGDAVITAECCWDYPVCMPFVQGFRVRLEGATLHYPGNSDLVVYPADGEAFIPELDVIETRDLGINVDDFGIFADELSAFADHAIEGKGKSPIPLTDGIGALRLINRELDGANFK